MWNRLKEQSTWTGIAISGLTYLQVSGDWKGAALAILASVFKVLTPENSK